MKKAFSLLLVLMLLLLLFGCNRTQSVSNASVKFYYRTADVTFGTEGGVIASEVRNITTNDVEAILQKYLQGPESEKLISPFPENLKIESYDSGPARTSFTLSAQISDLKDYELTIACTCIAKTIFELTGTRSVEIKSESGLIGGMQSVVLMRNNLMIYDDHFEASEPTS